MREPALSRLPLIGDRISLASNLIPLISKNLPDCLVILNRRACIAIHVASQGCRLKPPEEVLSLSSPFKPARSGIALMVLLLASCSHSAFAASKAQ
jgi:hypothetical protein